MPLCHTLPGGLAQFRRWSSLASFGALVKRLYAHIGVFIGIPIITHIGQNCKRKRVNIPPYIQILTLTFPAVFPCAICFYLEMHKLQQCKDDYITAFLVSSRSPVLLADDTSGIVCSIPATVTITAYKADFHALQTIII